MTHPPLETCPYLNNRHRDLHRKRKREQAIRARNRLRFPCGDGQNGFSPTCIHRKSPVTLEKREAQKCHDPWPGTRTEQASLACVPYGIILL
jgi:hypothetical protein